MAALTEFIVEYRQNGTRKASRVFAYNSGDAKTRHKNETSGSVSYIGIKKAKN